MHLPVVLTSTLVVSVLARPQPVVTPAAAQDTPVAHKAFRPRQDDLASLMSRFSSALHDVFPDLQLPSVTTQPESPSIGAQAVTTSSSRRRPTSQPIPPVAAPTSTHVPVIVQSQGPPTPATTATSSSRRRPSSVPIQSVAAPSVPGSQPQPSPIRSIADPVSTGLPGSQPPPSSVRPIVPSSSPSVPVSQPSTPPPSPGNHISGTAQAALTAGPDYQAAILYHHNAARANHNAAPLTWDAECERNAGLAARTCDFAHYIPTGVREGQNIFTTTGAYFNVTAAITEYWYKSEFAAMLPHYGETDLSDAVFHSVGHLTQLVWKGTTKVGCVSLDCGNSMTINGAKSSANKFTVCNYAPPGNVGGQYALNIERPRSTTNLGRWTD